eukprot:jgi/Mesvir1/24830/Mv22070-RA.1
MESSLPPCDQLVMLHDSSHDKKVDARAYGLTAQLKMRKMPPYQAYQAQRTLVEKQHWEAVDGVLAQKEKDMALMQAQLLDQQARAVGLERDLQHSEARAGKAGIALAEKEKLLVVVEAQLLDQQARADGLEHELLRSRARAATAERALADEVEALAEREGQLLDQLGRAGEVEQELQRSKVRTGDLEQQLQRSQARAGEVEQELQRLQVRAGELEQQLQDLQARANALKQQQQRSEARAATAESAMASKEKHLAEKKAQLLDQQAIAAKLDRQLLEAQSVLKEVMERRDEDGNTALHSACRMGCSDVGRFLLASGANRDARNKREETPLHLASQLGHLDIVRLLVENGVDKEAEDFNSNKTPLHWASILGLLDIVQLLVESSANKEAKDKFGHTPLSSVAEWGLQRFAEHLTFWGAVDITAREQLQSVPLVIETPRDFVYLIRDLVTDGAYASAKDKVGNTLLVLSKQFGNLDIIQFLIERGADVNAVDKDPSSHRFAIVFSQGVPYLQAGQERRT